MKTISNAEFGGERPLFESHDLRLENVIIHAGESAIKECSNIEAIKCKFEGNLLSTDAFSISEDVLPCGIPII